MDSPVTPQAKQVDVSDPGRQSAAWRLPLNVAALTIAMLSGALWAGAFLLLRSLL